ncbi:hypothetical protein JCM15519_27950 [Fundidesulfovibrio butyratiphilus]
MKPLIAIVQARMSSRRFPGKVLAPFLGKPLLARVVERLRAFDAALPVVVATSDQASDDPLALFAASLGAAVTRGPLEDVLGRFMLALDRHPCRAFFRVCADSPVLDPALFAWAAEVFAHEPCDLVTNVLPRTYPPGRSVELVRTETFRAVERAASLPEEREHVTKYFYANAGRFRIVSIANPEPAPRGFSLAVDEPGDLARVEDWCLANEERTCRGAPCGDGWSRRGEP